MKVKDLKKKLEEFDDEDEVILSEDSEGNGFSPLDDFWEAVYVPETTWYGNVYYRELTPDMIAQGFSEEDAYHGKDGINAVVLYPAN